MGLQYRWWYFKACNQVILFIYFCYFLFFLFCFCTSYQGALLSSTDISSVRKHLQKMLQGCFCLFCFVLRVAKPKPSLKRTPCLSKIGLDIVSTTQERKMDKRTNPHHHALETKKQAQLNRQTNFKFDKTWPNWWAHNKYTQDTTITAGLFELGG